MNIRHLAVGALALTSVFAAPPSYGQALEGRMTKHSLIRVREAVLAGQIPEADTWPQPVPADNPGAVTGSRDVSFSLGGALRTEESSFWDSYLFRYADGSPLVRWSLHGEEKDHWGFGVLANFRDDETGWHPTSLILPRPGNIFPLERHFIDKSWLWYNFKPLQVEIGREQIHWGPLDHSLIIGDQIPFLDMVRGELDAGPFGLDWVVSTPETRTTGGNVDLADFQLLSLHRLSFKTTTWRVSLSERYIVHRSSGPFVLADLFPVGSYHQNDIDPNNNCMYVDGEWVPAPGWRLMGQYGLDDVDATLFGVPDYAVPTIWGFLAGAEWQGQLNDDPIRLYAEVGGTHYLWDNFSDPKARATYYLALDGRSESMDLSSPYGPGTFWVNLSARWAKGPVTLTALLEVFDTKEGVDETTDYSYHWDLEGFGSHPSERFSVTGRWTVSPNVVVALKPTQTYHLGVWGLEGRASLEWSL